MLEIKLSDRLNIAEICQNIRTTKRLKSQQRKPKTKGSLLSISGSVKYDSEIGI